MLELAARLRAMSREELAAALRGREFDANGSRDLFDLAEALLAADSIDQAISRLDRPHLAVLAAAATIATADGSYDDAALTAELERLDADEAILASLESLVADLEARLLIVAGEHRRHV